MIINDFLHYSQVPPGQGSGERDVFGAPMDGMEYVYSDRLMEWDLQKYNKSVDAVTAEDHTSEWYEEFLSLYFEKPVELVHMRIGVNVSSGYQYNVYGFRYKED